MLDRDKHYFMLSAVSDAEKKFMTSTPDVTLVTLFPSELHATVLTLELFLGRMHRAHVDGETVVAAVHFAAHWTSHFVVRPLFILVNVAYVLLQVSHEREGGVAGVTLERSKLEVRAVNVTLEIAVVPKLLRTLVARIDPTLFLGVRFLFRSSTFRFWFRNFRRPLFPVSCGPNLGFGGEFDQIWKRRAL
jgi:hypothetical protein